MYYLILSETWKCIWNYRGHLLLAYFVEGIIQRIRTLELTHVPVTAAYQSERMRNWAKSKLWDRLGFRIHLRWRFTHFNSLQPLYSCSRGLGDNLISPIPCVPGEGVHHHLKDALGLQQCTRTLQKWAESSLIPTPRGSLPTSPGPGSSQGSIWSPFKRQKPLVKQLPVNANNRKQQWVISFQFITTIEDQSSCLNRSSNSL